MRDDRARPGRHGPGAHEGAGHLQHQGGRGEDGDGREPGLPGRRQRRPHARVGSRPAGRGQLLLPGQAQGEGRGRGASSPAAGRSIGPSRAPTTTTSTWCRPTSRTATWTSTSTPPRSAPVASTCRCAPLANEYDYVFLDCPPSISLVSENVFRAADALLVPLIPTTLSLRTLAQLDAFLADHPARKKQPVLAFFSMVDQRKKLHRELIDQGPGRPPRHARPPRSRPPATSSAWACTGPRCRPTPRGAARRRPTASSVDRDRGPALTRTR